MTRAKIILTRAEVQRLVDFCKIHNEEHYFIAKDYGAYLGANAENATLVILYYFPGCNPTKDKNWYDTAHALFGGDDFGEHLPIKELSDLLAEVPSASEFCWIVVPDAISLSYVIEA
jgi:Protein of unknown function (DUF3085)